MTRFKRPNFQMSQNLTYKPKFILQVEQLVMSVSRKTLKMESIECIKKGCKQLYINGCTTKIATKKLDIRILISF